MQAAGDRAQAAELVEQRIGPALDRPAAAGERRDDVGPSVAGIRHEFLEHRERRGLAHAGVLQPAREPRHVAEGGSGGEKAGDLEIRVEAGLGPAQRLEHEIAHHDGGVALLAGEPPDGQRVRIGREGPARGGPESEAAVTAVGRAAGGDGGEDAAAESRVVVGVHHRLRAGAGERGLRRGLGRHGGRDVVPVTVHRDEQEHERPVRVEDGPVEHVHRRDAAGLGREPALADQEAREIGAAGAREQRDERGGIRVERPRCHRAAGRAAGGCSRNQ